MGRLAARLERLTTRPPLTLLTAIYTAFLSSNLGSYYQTSRRLQLPAGGCKAGGMPLLPLEREVGGIVWILACGGRHSRSGIAGCSCSLAIPALVVGLLLMAYTRLETFSADVLLANDNHIMLVLVAGFVWAHLSPARTGPRESYSHLLSQQRFGRLRCWWL